jgi:hypothetical protein
MPDYAVAGLDEIDELADQGHRYRPVRHHLGITSFGVTAWTAREAGDPIIAAYDEDSEPSEELFLVVRGRATFTLEGETVDVQPGTLVSTRPGVSRTAIAAEPGTTILAFDGSPGKAYDATGWELWAPLVPLYRGGQHAELAATLRGIVAANPQYPMLAYNLACCESMSDRADDAIEHLRQAIAASERFRADARDDSDFDPIRDEAGFEALISSTA